MTKESLALLEAAAVRVEQAIDVLEEAQEILAENDENFEFPVGIIFSAQTSLRVVAEVVRDIRAQARKGQRKRAAGGKKGAARKAAEKVKA
ncbi:MAG: hypothetical protein H6Q10_65 [Acidobacteria bacterium]|jgi:endonuclease III|nr:hypothetical protein [Acidobacteriota bacterium]